MECELRVGIIGCGSVAAVHARQLRKMADVELRVACGPEAQDFAAEHGFLSVAASIGSAIPLMDVAIVCSPSQMHYAQSVELLRAGIPVLVEFPACGSELEAREIGEVGRDAYVACAHTSRYLEAFRRLRRVIDEGELGMLRQINYVRHIPPRQRSWRDDALTHHAAHVLDLLLQWFGVVAPVSCVARPVEEAQDLTLKAIAGEGAQVVVDISYTSQLPRLEMTISGDRHSVSTDGFGFVRGDAPGLDAKFDGGREYERAIFLQDRDFLRRAGVPWSDTVRLARLTDGLRESARGALP
jgi:2-hydroxy-4-carboxymuconate semialdehyde hemiacetal dehydrogenase